MKSNKLLSIIIFIYFRKAFDSINRYRILKILYVYGIPQSIISAISTLHENIRARVLTPDGETDSFKITVGVLQGDTLAPFLFVIVLDYAMRTALKGKEELSFMLTKILNIRHPAITITSLSYADDIAIITNQIEQA